MLSASVGSSTATKKSEADSVEPSMKCSTPHGQADRHGRKRDGDELWMRGRTARRLAEATGEMPGERQQERREPERPERGNVQYEPGPEARARTEDRPAKKSERDDENEHEVRVTLGHLDGRGDRNLDERGEQKEGSRLDGVGDHRCVFVPFAFGLATRTMTSSSESKSTRGATWMRLYRSTSCWPTDETVPIGMPRG